MPWHRLRLFVDATLAAPAFDVQAVRSYDTRRAAQHRGCGWQRDLRGPRVRSNRPIGEGYGIFNIGGPFSLPRNAQGESRLHFTEVRISDDEYYVFRRRSRTYTPSPAHASVT